MPDKILQFEARREPEFRGDSADMNKNNALRKLGPMILSEIEKIDGRRAVVSFRYKVSREYQFGREVLVDRFRVELTAVQVDRIVWTETMIDSLLPEPRVVTKVVAPTPWYSRLAAAVAETWSEAGDEVQRCKA